MAILQSTQSGNTNTAPFAFGVAVANGDQLQITNSAHAVTFNANVTVGISPCEQKTTRPTMTAVTGTPSLPAGTYRCRLVAVGSTGEAHPSGPTSLAISATQFARITVPALTAGATSYSIYLSNTGGALGTERRYATGVAPGTYDCASASWMDGTATYAAATALPFGAAIGYPISVTGHAGGFAVATGVTVTLKGTMFLLGQLTLNAGSIVEFDATDSPSGAAVYRMLFGNQDNRGTPKLVMRGTSASRAIVRSKAGTTAACLTIASQFSVSSDMQLDLEWFRFSNMGDATNPSVNCRNTLAYNQILTDGIFDDDCSTVDFNSQPGTGGWIITRVAFKTAYALGHIQGSRHVCVAFRASSGVTTGVRTVTACTFDTLQCGIQGGGALWTNCYFANGWALISGSVTGSSVLTNSFVRKLMPDAQNGVDTLSDPFNDAGCFLYIDQVTGGGADLNPHGLGMLGGGLGTTKIHDSWVVEYNATSTVGDAFKSPTGQGVVRLSNNLIIPNHHVNKASSGNMMTLGNATDPDLKLEFLHNTFVGENNGINTSEGGPGTAGTITLCRSNLVFSYNGASTQRWVIAKASGDGQNDTFDVAIPSGVSHNAGWNLGDVTGNWVGAYSWYNTRFSSAPGASDVDLGDSPAADLTTFGPQFVDWTRNFLTWCETVLSATGTEAQKIQKGLDTLRAIADTTSADYVAGVTNDAPALWIREGFAPQAAALNPATNPGHDGLTIGAMTWVGAVVPPTPGKSYAQTIRKRRNDKVLVFGV